MLGLVDASSCGLWAASGYTNSRRLTVHALSVDEEADTHGPWRELLRTLAARHDNPHGWLQELPAGHPTDPCPGSNCVLRRQA
jgi:hypothetical protein